MPAPRTLALVLGGTLAAAAAPLTGLAQDTVPARRGPAAFFATEEPLAITLAANLAQLRRDVGDRAPWRPGTVAYTDADGRARVVPLQLRTRGIWRLRNCAFPPLRLNFAAATARGTPFEGLDKPKMVNYCRDNAEYEQYVLQELQLYRILALLTPVSHRVRLVRTTYVDGARGTPLTTRHAILLEEPDALAARIGGRVLEAKGARADDLDPFQAALVGVFQYMIGNSDWSTGGLHNAELVAREGTFSALLVPYDFDFTGAVNPPYATVDGRLPIKSVRQRLYRGHCAPAADYERVFALFRERKDAIYALYADPIGRLVEPERVRDTLRYFDAFYATINSARLAKRDIVDACHAAQ